MDAGSLQWFNYILHKCMVLNLRNIVPFMENVYLCTSLCNHKRNIFFKSFLGHFSTAHTHLVHIHSRSDTHTHIPWNDIVQGWRNVMCIKGSQIPFKWALVKLAQILLSSSMLADVLLCLETKYYKYMCPSLFWRISTSPWILSK